MAVPRQHAPAQEQPADMASLLRAPSKNLVSSAVLAMAPTAPFLLKHHWNAWEPASEGLDECLWVPVFKKHVIRPGINQVHTLRVNQKAEEAYQDGVRDDERLGWTFVAQHPLHEDHRPANVPEGPYIREAPCRDERTGTSGVAYLEAWQVPLPTMPGDEDGQRFKFDRASYNRWRVWLVETGQIAQPQPHVLAKMRTRMEARVPATKAKQFPTSDMTAVMVAKAELQAKPFIEAKIPEVDAPPAPPPPKERKSKAKAAPADDAKAAT